MTDNLLIEAKNLAIENIQDMLKDHIYNGILIIYNTALDRNKSETLKLFQKSLSSIRTSSDYVLKEDYKFLCQSLVKIGRSEQELTTNIENIFLCYAKLALIGRGFDTTKKLKVTDLDIPTNIYFLHQSYINSAREIYHNAYLYSHKFSPEQRIKNKITTINIIKDAIKKTINECIHVDTILKKYLSNDTDIEQSPVVVEDTDENVNNLMNFNIDTAIAEQGTDVKDSISRKLTGKNIAELQKALVNINKQDIETFKTSVGTGLTSIDLSASKITKGGNIPLNEITPVSLNETIKEDQNKNSLSKENPEGSIMKSFNETAQNTEIHDLTEMEDNIQETKPIQFIESENDPEYTKTTEISDDLFIPIEFTEVPEQSENTINPIEFTEIQEQSENPEQSKNTIESENPDQSKDTINPIEFTEIPEQSKDTINPIEFTEIPEQSENPTQSKDTINPVTIPLNMTESHKIDQVDNTKEIISVVDPINHPIENNIPVHKSDVIEFNDGYISEDFIKSIILDQFNQNVDKSFNKFKDYTTSISKK